MVWDTIEFDNAVRGRPRVRRPHEPRRRSGERHARDRHGRPRDRRPRASSASATSAMRRRHSARRCATMPRCSASRPTQQLNFVPNYEPDAQGFPVESGSVAQAAVRVGRGAGSLRELAVESLRAGRARSRRSLENARGSPDRRAARASIANPRRDGDAADSDNKTVDGRARAGVPRRRRHRERRARLPRPARVPCRHLV